MKNIISKYKKLSIITKASVWAFIANVVQRGVTIIATPLFTRILTTEEYAQYTLYQSWHDIFIIFVSMNVFNYCTYSAMKEYEDDRDGFIATAQTLTTGLAIICFALYYFVQIICGNVLGFPLPIVILMFVDMVFFASFNLWCTKKRYEFKYRVMTFLSILIGIMGPVLGVLAIYYLPNKGYGRIYGVAAINILVGLIIYIYNISKSKKIFNLKYVKFIFVYCIPLIPHFLASQILARFDRIMIGDICGESQAGIYSLAYSLSLLLMIFNDAILKSLTPWTYQTIKKSNSVGLNKLKTTATNMVLFVAAANIGLILFAPEAIKIFATSEYYEAIYIIPPVSASVFFTFLFNIFANIEYYYSETKYVGIASASAAILNIILNYIFIKQYGYIAAGYTTMICYILYAICHFIFMNIVSKKHANRTKYYDNKAILCISIIFSAICLGIIPLYRLATVRYALIAVIILILLLSKNKIIDFLNTKSKMN